MIVDDACDLRKNTNKNKGEFSSKAPNCQHDFGCLGISSLFFSTLLVPGRGAAWAAGLLATISISFHSTTPEPYLFSHVRAPQ